MFVLSDLVDIYVRPATDEVTNIGRYLAGRLSPSAGFEISVLEAADIPPDENIHLILAEADPGLGEEGYILTITPQRVTLMAYRPAGLFRGCQTIRQLLPPSIERATAQPGSWTLPTLTIRDYPRFEWRGAMLDVARHFFSVDDVKRYIDLLAYYKMNRLHLHLTDDQGWRIMIDAWPNLAAHGGSTQVGGGPGGYYTQADYADIAAYAQSRYIMVIPEIDMPGHTHAALASYASLTCDGAAPPLYTGTEVGFSSLCVGKNETLAFVGDVVREIAALTPGPYIHIGGDEALSTEEAEYRQFIEQVQAVVEAQGKHMIGWEEIAKADLQPGSVVQHWRNGEPAKSAAQQGNRVIMSPAFRIYLDMKYDETTPLGLSWAGYIDVKTAYDWDPASQVEGMPESSILGIEAPLWSETLETISDIEYMAFPRLPGYAEIGWSPLSGKDWEAYKRRLAAHGARWDAMHVNFHRAASIAWEE